MLLAAKGIAEQDRPALAREFAQPIEETAVDLHQFAQAFTPPPRLVRRGLAVTAVDPQAVRDHPLSQRLDAEAQAVTRDKLLRRERGTKIGIVLQDQCQNGAPERLAMLVVARATAFAGTQRRCAISSESTTQPENLAPPQTHQRRDGLDCDPAVCQVDHDTIRSRVVPDRSFGSPSSHVTPNVSTTACLSEKAAQLMFNTQAQAALNEAARILPNEEATATAPTP
jgi:hypothetical protein